MRKVTRPPTCQVPREHLSRVHHTPQTAVVAEEDSEELAAVEAEWEEAEMLTTKEMVTRTTIREVEDVDVAAEAVDTAEGLALSTASHAAMAKKATRETPERTVAATSPTTPVAEGAVVVAVTEAAAVVVSAAGVDSVAAVVAEDSEEDADSAVDRAAVDAVGDAVADRAWARMQARAVRNSLL